MQFKSLTFLAATIVASLFSIEAQASTIVYNQAPNGSQAGQSAILNAAGDPGFNWTSDSDTQRWAYFGITTGISFNRISWYGSNADGNFAVDLFSATCFSCSAAQVGGSGTFTNNLLPNSGPFTQADVHKTLLSGSLYSYYIDLSSSVTLAANQTSGTNFLTSYAISIVNNYSSSPFIWEASNTGSGTSLVFTIGQAIFLPNPNNLSFTLTDTSPPTPTPLPAALPLFASGLGALGLLGWRRKRKAALAAA